MSMVVESLDEEPQKIDHLGREIPRRALRSTCKRL
jgi:hypothetical protein